jgi:hypothetical protein
MNNKRYKRLVWSTVIWHDPLHYISQDTKSNSSMHHWCLHHICFTSEYFMIASILNDPYKISVLIGDIDIQLRGCSSINNWLGHLCQYRNQFINGCHATYFGPRPSIIVRHVWVNKCKSAYCWTTWCNVTIVTCHKDFYEVKKKL